MATPLTSPETKLQFLEHLPEITQAGLNIKSPPNSVISCGRARPKTFFQNAFHHQSRPKSKAGEEE
jgi:hypothetical protein